MKDSRYYQYVSYFLSGMVLAFATLTPSTGNATVYYVSKTGNDSYSGTEISPFRNIKHGVSSLSAGDTLYVKAGTYNESILSWKTTIPNGTSWDNPVTVAANPGDIVIINPPSGLAFFWVKDGQDKYLIIDGFIVDGLGSALYGFGFTENSRHIRVQNTEVKNAKATGILITVCAGCSNSGKQPRDTYHEFLNLNVHHNGSSGLDHGFYITTSHNVIDNSVIHNNLGYGVHVYHSTNSTANYNTIRNSTLYENNSSGMWGCGLLLSSGTGNIAYNNVAYSNYHGFCALKGKSPSLYNNISYGNTFFGIYVGTIAGTPPPIGSMVLNNTIYNNGSYGIFVGDSSQDAVIRNNISYQNNTANIFLEPNDQTGTTESHNLTEDPLFLDAEAKIFSLNPKSSAIDAAMTIPEVSVDFFGVKRAQGNAYDIGAIELETLVDTTPPRAPIEVKAY